MKSVSAPTWTDQCSVAPSPNRPWRHKGISYPFLCDGEWRGGQMQCQTGWAGVDVSEHYWWSFLVGSDKMRRKQRKTNTSESRLQLKAADSRARWQRLVLISCVHTRTRVSDVTKGAEPLHLHVMWVCISTEIHVIHTCILCIMAGFKAIFKSEWDFIVKKFKQQTN